MSQHPGPWRTSSHSGGGNACVEIRSSDTGTDVRDSKNPAGPTLSFRTTNWHAFITANPRHP